VSRIDFSATIGRCEVSWTSSRSVASASTCTGSRSHSAGDVATFAKRSAGARRMSPSERHVSGSIGAHQPRGSRAHGAIRNGATRARGSRSACVVVDGQRLTSWYVSVRDEHTFPLIFYRDNCADSALCEMTSMRPGGLIAGHPGTGSHFSIPEAARAQRRRSMSRRRTEAKSSSTSTIDPICWGIGRTRWRIPLRSSATVTTALTCVLPIAI